MRARRGIRIMGIAGGLAVLALGSSGCVIVRDDLITQPNLIGGEFSMNVRACVSNATAACPSGGTSNTFPGLPPPGTTVQVLGGIQLPSSYVLPEVLDRVDPSAPTTRFTRSPTYEAELTRLLPPPQGERWFGYISDPFSTFVGGATYLQTLTIGRVRTADGEPIPALRAVSYVAGGRIVNADALASRPVDCTDFTICVDSRLDRTDPVLHDLALQAPATVTAAPGTTAVIPVTARFAGTAGPEFAFALTAATTLPGASATVNVPTLTPPADSTSAVSVSVPVPVNAAPGQYPVTVTATIGGPGTSVSAKATLIVPAAAPSVAARRPAVSLRGTRGLTAKNVRTRGLPVRVTTDVATSATVTVTQTRRVRVGRRFVTRAVQLARRTTALPAGTTTVRLRSGAFRPGTAVVKVTGTGFSARTTVVLG